MTAEIELNYKGVTQYFKNDILLKSVDLVENCIFDWIMTERSTLPSSEKVSEAI